MMSDMAGLGSAFWVAFAGSALFAYPIYRLLLAWKSRQTISQYAPEGHQAKQGTPTMGGLIIIAGYFASLVYLTFFTRQAPTYGLKSIPNTLAWYGPWALLFGGFALIGFVDDFVVPRLFKAKRGLGWKQKILMQVVLATIAAFLLHGQFDLTLGIAVFLILFFSNAYNFADGLDGLAGSILLALAGGLAVLATGTIHGFALSAVLVPLVGAVIPFLFLNAPPAKVFMGDVGSLPVGAVLGMAVACEATRLGVPGSGTVESWGVPLMDPLAMAALLVVISLVMVAELVPVPLQILSVKIRKKRLFPYTPIHHAFEKAGWPETRVVWVFALTQLLLSCLAIYVFFVLAIDEGGRGRYFYDSSPESGSTR
jgi:phospho-N-acetylmuramoyl-pentapeptide-transferase